MEVCNPFQANKTMIVRQAANALEILEYFARRLKPATPAEIAEDLGWPRSSTFKLVGTLASKGYLYEPRARGGYSPIPRKSEERRVGEENICTGKIRRRNN